MRAIPEHWKLFTEHTPPQARKFGVEFSSSFYGRIVIGVGETYEEAWENAILEAERESTPAQRAHHLVWMISKEKQEIEKRRQSLQELREHIKIEEAEIAQAYKDLQPPRLEAIEILGYSDYLDALQEYEQEINPW